jgi:hypothetical protein
MKEWMSIHLSWRKFLVSYALITLFSWAVTSSLHWIIVIGTLLPAGIFLLIGRSEIRLRTTLLIVTVFFIVNITATKNPILFPIAYNGTLTYSEQFTHTGSSRYADYGYPPPAYDQTVISPCFRDYSNREDNLREPKVVPGVPYPVKVDRDIVPLSEVVPFYATEFTVGPKDVGGPYFAIVERDIFYRSYSSQFHPDGVSYFNQCVRYNKPLVSLWVVILEKLFTPLTVFSYVILVIVVIVACVRRIIPRFWSKYPFS